MRLLARCDVGAELRLWARSPSAIHRALGAGRPQGLLATSTHDSKRGEDARARINVLSELPSEWRVHLNRWAAINEAARTPLNGTTAPDRNDEWMFYQTLIGAWPAETVGEPVPESADPVFVERIQQFMRKALKEAKRHTEWLHQNVAYEQAVESFVQQVLAGDRARPFLASFVPFQRRLMSRKAVWHPRPARNP